MKAGVVGVGRVGGAIAFALAREGDWDELVVVDAVKDLPRAQAEGLRDRDRRGRTTHRARVQPSEGGGPSADLVATREGGNHTTTPRGKRPHCRAERRDGIRTRRNHGRPNRRARRSTAASRPVLRRPTRRVRRPGRRDRRPRGGRDKTGARFGTGASCQRGEGRLPGGGAAPESFRGG